MGDESEKIGIFEQSDLDGFAEAADPMGIGQRTKHGLIVDDGPGNGEGSEVVFFLEGVDAVLDSHGGVGLAQGGRGDADESDPSMGHGGSEPDDVEQGAPPHRDDIRVPAQAGGIDGPEDLLEVARIIFERFAGGKDLDRLAEFKNGMMGADELVDLIFKVRLSVGESLVEKEGRLNRTAVLRAEQVD